MLVQRNGVKELILDSLVFSISQLNSSVKSVLENNEYLCDFYVKGELSNLRKLESGSVFFTLKEKSSSLKCFMGKINADDLDDSIREGDSVIVRGSISVYASRGEYYLEAEDVYKQGIGDLHKRFLELKQKLSREGLFDETRKRKVPGYPGCIGIVTSPSGVVIKDILDTLKRRYPLAKVVVSPAVVQGEEGAKSVVKGIGRLEERGVDVIIIARGGGSLEDLWCFNSEELARKIRSCEIPVITGIGHETDYTIADFVADLRAPTPSIAAERAAPDKEELLGYISYTARSVEGLARQGVAELKSVVEDATYRVRLLAKSSVEKNKSSLLLLENNIRNLNHEQILLKGYALVECKGKRVTANNILEGDELIVLFKDGKIKAKVLEVRK